MLSEKRMTYESAGTCFIDDDGDIVLKGRACAIFSHLLLSFLAFTLQCLFIFKVDAI